MYTLADVRELTAAEQEPARDRDRWWFAWVLLIGACMLLVISAVRPMASYRALELGATPLEIGLLPASFAALSLFVAVPVGRWIDRFGEARFLLLGTVIMTASTAAMVWIDSIPLLIVTQALLGLGHIVNIVGAQTLIANRSTAEQRDHRFGMYSVAVSLGQLIGPAMAGFIAGGQGPADGDAVVSAATIPVFAVAAAACAPALLAALVLVRTSSARPRGSGAAAGTSPLRSAAQVLRIPTMLPAIVVSVAVILSIDLLTAYLPVYGEERGLSVEVVGGLLSLRAATTMASRLVMGRLIASAGRARVLFGSTVLAGLAMAGVPFLGDPWGLGLLMALTGFGLGFGQPMTIAWVAGRAPRELRATALGVRLTGNRLGQLVIPALVGLLAGFGGVGIVFVSLAVVLTGAAAIVAATPFDGAASERSEPPD